MIPFPLFLACKYLKPKRTFVSVVMVISVTGVVLGVASLIVVMSVMGGFGEIWQEKILSFKPHITVTSYTGIIKEDEALCRKIDKVEGVTGVSPSVETRVLMQFNNRPAAPIVIGLDPERASQVTKIPEKVDFGEFLIDDDHLVLGIDLASSLGLNIGRKALIYSPQNVVSKDEMYLPEELTVSGIFNFGMRDFDSGFVLTSISTARELVGIDRGAYSLYVMTSDPVNVEACATNVSMAVGSEYRVQTWKEVDTLLFNALKYEKAMIAVLIGMITVVAIFSIINVLIVITYQKTSEIGLLKALGVPSWMIMMAFMVLGWIQCIVGIVLGLSIGYVILVNLTDILDFLSGLNIEAFPKDIYGLDGMPWTWEWASVAKIVLFTFFFCTLTSLLPAARALWLDPVDALRHE